MIDELAFRETVFAWLRARMLVQPVFTRDDLAEVGSAAICNGLALCKIHHGAFDANMLGITPDYRVRIKESVLDTFDGPTLQHALKEIDGAQLAQVPTRTVERPDRGLLDERYQRFLRHAN